MRVLVIGGTRFIGRAIVEELSAAGHEVLLVHRGQTEPDGLPEVAHVHVERARLGDEAPALRGFRPDAFIDCMATTRANAAVVARTLAAGLHGPRAQPPGNGGLHLANPPKADGRNFAEDDAAVTT